MIKTIFFDFDGVLTTDTNGSGTVCRNLQKLVPDLSFDELYRCSRGRHSLVTLGKATHADIWNEFCSCVGKEIDIAILYEALRYAPKNEPMFELCQTLRKNYKTGIITDNTKERFDALIQEMQLDQYFDFLVLSADIGSTKNESLIFEEALRMANSEAQECVFIDNQQRNLDVPAKMGFRTYWHDDATNDLVSLRRQLKAWNVVME